MKEFLDLITGFAIGVAATLIAEWYFDPTRGCD